MSLYKRKDKFGSMIPYWYCEFEHDGKIIRRSTDVLIGTASAKAEERSKAKARQAEALMKQDYFQEQKQLELNGPCKPEIAVEEFSKKFLEWVEVKHKGKPKTVTYYKERVASLLRFDPLKKCLVSRVDQELIADLVKHLSTTTKVYGIRAKAARKATTADTFQRLSVATINRNLTVLGRMLNLAKEWKYRTAEPKIRRLSGEKSHERVINHDEEHAYLSAASDLLRDFATIALDTGLRPDSELLRLRWEHVHLQPAGNAKFGYLHIPDGKTANAKRNVSMSPRVHAIFERRHKAAGEVRFGLVFQRDKEQMPYCVIDSAHDRTCEKIGFRFRIYDFRHTFGTRLGEAGADAFTIMKLMGHSSISISQRYVHPTPERVETAFMQLDAYNEQRAQAAQKKAEAKSQKQTA